jgi:hypothetical protein
LHEGTLTIPIALAGSVYPNVPQISNFAELNTFDPQKDFTVRWFPFINGRDIDFINFQITGAQENTWFTTYLQSGLPGQPTALTGRASSATIPANTLRGQMTYRIDIWFAKVYEINTTAYPGAIGYSGYGQGLQAYFKTGGAISVPYFIEQPSSTSIKENLPASFHVTASGPLPLVYQWQKDNSPILGATNDWYSIGNARLSDMGNYSVIVSNAGGSVTSIVARLTVTPNAILPTITAQPQGQTVNVGAKITLNVTAIGTPSLFYQWVKNGVNIPGETNAFFTINSVQQSDSGSYSAVVSNSAGSVSSTNAIIAVIPKLIAPTIAIQPQSQAVKIGGNAVFSVVANGSEPLTYQWQKGNFQIVGATNSIFSITNVKVSDSGSYSVNVKNSAGSVTSAFATLTVDQVIIAPTITEQPQNLTLLVGSSANFTVTVSGSNPFSYQWRKDSLPIYNATNQIFIISSVSFSDAGNYSVVVGNSIGSVTSVVANLTIKSDSFSSELVNGSFEIPSLAVKDLHLSKGDQRLIGWTIGGSGGPVGVFRGPDSSLNFPAIDGLQQLVFNSGETPSGTFIQQGIKTIVGAAYEISFFVGRHGSVVGEVSITAYVRSAEGRLLAQIKALPPAHGFGSEKDILFVATSDLTTVTFEDTSLFTGSVDVILDAVSMNIVGPLIDIRLFPLRISWNTLLTRSYQAQYSLDLANKQWLNIGSKMKGTGTQMVLTNDVVDGTHRFFRILEIP